MYPLYWTNQLGGYISGRVFVFYWIYRSEETDPKCFISLDRRCINRINLPYGNRLSYVPGDPGSSFGSEGSQE